MRYSHSHASPQKPSAQAHFPFLLPPALTVDKDHNDDDGDTGALGYGYVVPGQSVTYSITVNNVGASPANGIVITDTLPADWSFDSSVDPEIDLGSGFVPLSDPDISRSLRKGCGLRASASDWPSRCHPRTIR